MTIHYMTDAEDNCRTTTKTGCGVRAEDIGRNGSYVFWNGRQNVDCPGCIAKIERILKLQNRG